LCTYPSTATYRLKRKLESSSTTSTTENKPKTEIERTVEDFENRIEAGFQLATFQGPLCAEPMEGMVFFVERVEVDWEGVGRERGLWFSLWGL
jgi:ribosome assembly protein 1